ncbi:MAG: hypothetical protein Q9170_005447 [Blastenia crenularia]
MTSNQGNSSSSARAAADNEMPQNPSHNPTPESWSEEFVALILTTPIYDFVTSNPTRTDAETPENSPDELDIWSTILTIVRQNPYSSPAIPALITLLAATKETPTPAPLKYRRYTYWASLPHLGMAVRENWNRRIGEPAKNGKWTCTVAEWTSMNAFVAQCTISGVMDFQRYCRWAMTDALEEESGKRSKVGHFTDLDHFVPAAMVWVLVAGDVVLREWLGWKGEGGLPEKWVRWKERFGRIDRQEEFEVKEETREFARMAVERMEDVDRKGVDGDGVVLEKV